MSRRKKSKTMPYRIPVEFHSVLMKAQQAAAKKISKQDLLRQWAKMYYKRGRK